MFRVEAQWTGGVYSDGKKYDNFKVARGNAICRVHEGAVAADVINNETGEIVFTYDPCE